MEPVETFSTERLIATRLRIDDFDEIYRMHRDPKVMATLGGVRDEEETRQFFRRNLDHWDTHRYGLWILRDKTEDRFVGRAGLRNVTVGGSDEIEVAYALRQEWWGKGLATEIAKAILEVGFDRLGMGNIVCFTQTTNPASQRVMQKAGFEFERNIVHVDQPHVLCRIARVRN